jgi:uncharacterized protein with gpF-like domain
MQAVAKSPKTARAVHANRGIEAAYRKRLERLIAEMNNSVQYWLEAAYKKYPPALVKVIAEDAKPGEYAAKMQEWASVRSPYAKINKVIEKLKQRWIDKFNDAAPKIAQSYLKDLYKASDSAFMQALKASGWTINFKLTPAIRDSFTASLAENIGLIKSIPEQYLTQVEGIVARSYTAGRDLGTMTKDLQALYPKIGKRAALIARDQSNKANAVVNRTRQLELGITEAIWMHSYGGKEPRPDHVAANGKVYKIAQGCLISGEYIQPGELINCRCVSRPILPR